MSIIPVFERDGVTVLYFISDAGDMTSFFTVPE
jgi:hypothetical protein